jgi:hypothetical protein
LPEQQSGTDPQGGELTDIGFHGDICEDGSEMQGGFVGAAKQERLAAYPACLQDRPILIIAVRSRNSCALIYRAIRLAVECLPVS